MRYRKNPADRVWLNQPDTFRQPTAAPCREVDFTETNPISPGPILAVYPAVSLLAWEKTNCFV